MVKRRAASTLLELMVVMGLWAGLLVLILSFYVTATQINLRHDRISDNYRKVHELFEVLDSLLSRSRIYYVAQKEGVLMGFSRLSAEQPITPYGQMVWQDPEILVLGPSPEDTVTRDQIYPLYSQLTLTSPKTGKRVLWKFDLAWRVTIHPYIPPPPPAQPAPGNQHILVLDVRIPEDPLATPKTSLESEILQRYTYERYILLENSTSGGQ